MFDDIDIQKQESSKQNIAPEDKGAAKSITPPSVEANFSQRVKELKEKGKKQGKRKRIYSALGIVLILLFAGGAVAAGYYFWPEIYSLFGLEDEVELACQLDAKVCPDGFNVSRILPDCEFAECPKAAKNETCANKGEFINPDDLKGKTNYLDKCCEGLTGVVAYQVDETGECEGIGGTPYLTCVPCGDGICEEVDLWLENKCNCPEDCEELKTIDTSSDVFNWQTYRNDEYELEFKYPGDWLFDAEETGGVVSFLDIHLSNQESPDIPGCPEGYMGAEIQVGHIKEANMDFTSFVKSQVSTNKNGLNPGGALEQIVVDNHMGFKIEHSGWASGCTGQGYFIEQNEGQYIYVFTGSYLEETELKENDVIEEIIGSIKFDDQKELDTDEDGLTDDEEAEYGTDPEMADTDGDGHSDGDEVEDGYNPLGEGRLVQ